MSHRFLAVDYGTVRIGLAVGVSHPPIASPYRTIQSAGSPRKDAAAIAELARADESGRVVVGWPLNMDGTVGSQARVVERMVEFLKQATTLPVILWDERLSTHRADELLVDSGRRAGKGAAGRDAMSAQVILQSYLDAGAPAPPASDEGEAHLPGHCGA